MRAAWACWTSWTGAKLWNERLAGARPFLPTPQEAAAPLAGHAAMPVEAVTRLSGMGWAALRRGGRPHTDIPIDMRLGLEGRGRMKRARRRK